MILALALVLLGYLFEPPMARADEVPPTDALALSQDGVPEASRGEVIGSDWSESTDAAYVAVGDASGISILRANASDGYEWASIARISGRAGVETDIWISNTCITSDGQHMVVVYGPRGITNDEEGFGGGARAAIVNLSTGSIRDLGIGYTIAYFNPGCGSGNAAAITRIPEDGKTTLIAAVDASTGSILAKTEIVGTATSAVASNDGTIYASTGEGIVSVSVGGKPNVLVASKVLTYDLSLDEGGRLAYTSLVEKDETLATVSVVGISDRAKPTVIATGPLVEIGVRTSPTGGFFLTGAGNKVGLNGVAGVVELPEARPTSVVSSTGNLVLSEVLPAGIARAGLAEDPRTGYPRISAIATGSERHLDFTLTSVPLADDLDSVRPRTALSPKPNVGFMGDPNSPIEDERSCAVARNDPNNQAYQPKPRQVEWAVDRAVKGELTEYRLANWRGLGMPQYRAQGSGGYFPRVTLTGGGTIPPQIVLGVLMQESNLWQASRFTSPGDTGNPLIGDYYANRDAASLWDVTFADADCGYGVGQITDGMRLSGQERPGDVLALPYNQQRAIALDYMANVAMTVRMLGQKWNQLAAAGMQINNGNANRMENWFYAVWTYNTGYYPYSTSTAPWGVGWVNNPVNPIYPANRQPFLELGQGDAAFPQDWPYPEKVMGWGAWGSSLVETAWADESSREYATSYISSFTTAWWTNASERTLVKPPRTKFCSLTINDCNPASADPCQRSDDKCWFHASATWKNSCNTYCGNGNERFDSSYPNESDSMRSTLPPLTLQSSFLPDCDNPPAGVVVVDDTTHASARNSTECSQRSSAGSFGFTFYSPDSNGVYPAKVDLQQQGGGFNGHFSFAHMQANIGDPNFPGEQAYVKGTWSRGADMTNKWTRVWVHLPDYAAWSQAATYFINFGDGTSTIRSLPQRRYDNEWVSLGVFQMKGVPSVSLSNILPRDLDQEKPIFDGLSVAGVEDVAWDAVGFQELPAKPADFIVALGDSFSSGEGAGDYTAWSDNNGEYADSRNACHQSDNSWIRKTVLPGDTQSIGAKADSASNDLDFHFLACSGAESENLLPYYTAGLIKPTNSTPALEDGHSGQWSTVSQLDANYLDANTTLVTLSIGGNDIRFADIIQACISAFVLTVTADCSNSVLPDDTGGIVSESANRLTNELPGSLATVLEQIQDRAPNAQIAIMGYPKLFETGASCVMIDDGNMSWLNDLSDDLNGVISQAATDASSLAHPVFFVDPSTYFSGHNLCTGAGTSGINGLEMITFTPGENPIFSSGGLDVGGSPASQVSVHPNGIGTQLYADALEDALALHPW